MDQDELNYHLSRLTTYEGTNRIRAYISFLHYCLGKQHSTFSVQRVWPQPDADQPLFSKRRPAFDVLCDDDIEWIRDIGNRTLLRNEIVLDLDPERDETPDDFRNRMRDTIKKVRTQLSCATIAWTTGNRGCHIHIYDDKMFLHDANMREKIRARVCAMFGAETKATESVPIMMEYAPHRKTRRLKMPL